MKGLDFSYARPDPDWLAANYDFVMRYLCWLPNNKVIDKAEYDAYRQRGLSVGLNWEWLADSMIGGWGAGLIHAAEAKRQAIALGAWPCVIWFSCDSDIAQQDLINDYMNACASVLGRGNEGMYGGYWQVRRAMEAGAASHGWQTFAWSTATNAQTGERYTLWHPGAELRQVATPNAAAIGYNPTGNEWDLNEGVLAVTPKEAFDAVVNAANIPGISGGSDPSGDFLRLIAGTERADFNMLSAMQAKLNDPAFATSIALEVKKNLPPIPVDADTLGKVIIKVMGAKLST